MPWKSRKNFSPADVDTNCIRIRGHAPVVLPKQCGLFDHCGSELRYLWPNGKRNGLKRWVGHRLPLLLMLNVKWTTNLSNNLTVLSNNLALTRHKAYKVRHAEF